MKVKKISLGYYEVTEGDKWWTACLLTSGAWLITNHVGRTVSWTGKLGRQILAAVEAATT